MSTKQQSAFLVSVKERTVKPMDFKEVAEARLLQWEISSF